MALLLYNRYRSCQLGRFVAVAGFVRSCMQKYITLFNIHPPCRPTTACQGTCTVHKWATEVEKRIAVKSLSLSGIVCQAVIFSAQVQNRLFWEEQLRVSDVSPKAVLSIFSVDPWRYSACETKYQMFLAKKWSLRWTDQDKDRLINPISIFPQLYQLVLAAKKTLKHS